MSEDKKEPLQGSTIAEDHPVRLDLERYGLQKLINTVSSAPIPDWKNNIPAAKWKISLTDVEMILAKHRNYFLKYERQIYFKTWFTKIAMPNFKPTAFKAAIKYLKYYAELICTGLSKKNFELAINVLSKAVKMKETERKYQKIVASQGRDMWGPGKKGCSFTSSTFFKNTLKELCTYLDDKIALTKQEAETGLSSKSKRNQIILTIINAYYGKVVKEQSFVKFIERCGL